MSSQSRVSFVVLAYDGGDLLDRAVRSILTQTHPDVELVIVDNASSDGAVDRLVLPDGAMVVRNDSNRGYAAGMNQGIALASGAVVVPCNQDVVLHPDFASRAVAALSGHDRAAAIAPLVVHVDAEGELPTTGVVAVESGAQHLAWDMRVHDDGRSAEPHACLKPSGACPVYRRDVLDELSAPERAPFDVVFDTYGEDVDLALRLAAHGWQVRYEPGVLAGHTISSSSTPSVGDKRGRLRVNIVAGRHLNVWRHLPLPAALLAAVLVVVGDLAFVATRLVRRDLRVVADVGAAWVRVTRLAPALAAHRRTNPRARGLGLALRLGRRTDAGTIDLAHLSGTEGVPA